MQPVAEIVSGQVSLGGRSILHDVNLTVKAGEVVGILGSNGSGKSTLVRALTGLVPLASGDVRLFGTPLAAFKASHRVGFVPQRSSAASGIPTSVHEVVTAGRLSRRKFGPLRRSDRDAVLRALDLVDLTARRHDNVATLSGGQQQRALIARALVSEPELLILDEPNAGVDLLHQQQFTDTLRRLRAEGLTILVVLHEMGSLAELIDRLIVMRSGRITYDGVPPELVTPSHGHAHHPHLEAQASEFSALLPSLTSPLQQLNQEAP